MKYSGIFNSQLKTNKQKINFGLQFTEIYVILTMLKFDTKHIKLNLDSNDIGKGI